MTPAPSMRRAAYGVAIDADLRLGVPATDLAAALTIRRAPGPVSAACISWLDRTSNAMMSAGTVHGRFYLRFGNEAEFQVAMDGRTIQWHSYRGDVDDTLVHLVLDHVLPRALTRLHRVVLHGSCVALGPAGCLGIVGRSGSGKSTLAAALTARGCTLIADDCIVIDPGNGSPLVAPAYPELRLSDGSIELCDTLALEVVGAVSRFTAKSRVRPTGSSALPPHVRHPLLAVVALPHPEDQPTQSTGEPVTERLQAAAAGIELLSHAFQLNAADERAGAVRRLLPIAAITPVYRLRYDHTRAGLDRACEALLDLLAEPGRRAG